MSTKSSSESKGTETIRKSFGVNTYSMTSFLEKMIKKGQLKAYIVEIDKQTTERNDEKEMLVKIKKGATLTETKKIEEYGPPIIFIYSPSGVMYSLYTESHGGMIDVDTGDQTIYHTSIMTRLKNFDPLKVEKSSGSWGNPDCLIFPKEMKDAEMNIKYNAEDDGPDHGNLNFEGTCDDFFRKVYDFVKINGR